MMDPRPPWTLPRWDNERLPPCPASLTFLIDLLFKPYRNAEITNVELFVIRIVPEQAKKIVKCQSHLPFKAL